MDPADPDRVRRKLDEWDHQPEGGGIVTLGCGLLIGAAWMLLVCLCVWWGRR